MNEEYAVVLLVENEVLNRIRERHDRAFTRWPMHLTLAWPFVLPPNDMSDASPIWDAILRCIVRHCIPTQLTLMPELGAFRSGRAGNATFHVTPTADVRAQLDLLQQDVQTLNHASGRTSKRAFAPHVTLGQGDKCVGDCMKKEFQAYWTQEITLRVRGIALLKRDVSSKVMSTVASLELGSTGSNITSERNVYLVPSSTGLTR